MPPGDATSYPDPRSFLPLPAHDFQVLLGLAETPRHAYALATAAEANPDAVRLELGSLYRIIARLATHGLIEEIPPPSGTVHRDERRRYYRLTALGRKVAAAEAARLALLVRAARHHRLLPAEKK